MLGLSIGTDSGVPKLGRNNHKSYDFASRNIGRFHTSGVSGSMKKHTAKKIKEKPEAAKVVDEQDEKLRQLKDRSKSYVPERLEARQREIEEDTMQLLALEKKLDEVKRQKEMKRKREAGRQLHRLQYSSALIVQRLARKWLLKRRMRAATALQSFLKFAAAKQAVAAASWAISTLRGFVQMIEVKQQRANDLKEAARHAAITMWLHVEENSAAAVSEARKQAAVIAAHSIGVGTRTAVLQMHHQQQMKRKKIQNSPKDSPNARARAQQRWALLRRRVVPVGFMFHDPAWRRRTYFTDGYSNPATDVNHPHFKKGKLSMADVVLMSEERRKRLKMEEIARLHKQKEEAMRQEKILRLQMIDEQKKKKMEEISKQEEKNMKRQLQKEKSKVEFLRRVETEQSERAKAVNQIREKKEKERLEREALAKQELANEASENKLMYAEDVRFFQNLEKVRKLRLKEYSMKRKVEKEKAEKDFKPLPGTSQAAGGPGYLSARGKGGQDELSEQDLALEEERKMHIWAAHDNAMKQRLAARREAEKQEKMNAALEQEMIRKEKEIVAMNAQLMLKRAAVLRAKSKKIKEQAQENSNKHQHQEGTSTSARVSRSRGGSRGGARKRAGVDGRSGSGSAPTTARDSPAKKNKQRKHHQHLEQKDEKQNNPYDVHDPLALDCLQPSPRLKRGPDEDFDWHTPTAVGSGRSAISDLRRSKYSPILHKQEVERGSDILSPGGVRLNSAERLAMACRQGGESRHDPAPNPFERDEQDHEQQNDRYTEQGTLIRCVSVHNLIASPRRQQQQQLPPSPIEMEEDILKPPVKLPNIALAQTSSEGNINNKVKHIAGKGLLKSKYVLDKLENSPYGSLLPKERPKPQASAHEPSVVNKATPYLNQQTVVAPTSTFTAMTRPTRPSLQGISITTNTNASIKKSVKGDSLMSIVEKAREKLKQDQDILASKEETAAALQAATVALGGGDQGHGHDNKGCSEYDTAVSNVQQPPLATVKEKPKLKKKKKIKKKPAPPSPPKIIPKPKEKINKRKLINDTYTKIMKAEIQRKAEEKKAAERLKELDEEEVPPEVVENFFAMRRQAAANEAAAKENKEGTSKEVEKTPPPSHAYWSAMVGGDDDQSPSKEKTRLNNVTPQTAAAMGLINNPKIQPRKGNSVSFNVPKNSQHSTGTERGTSTAEESLGGHDTQQQPLQEKEDQDQQQKEEEEEPQKFFLDEQHLQLNSSPYEEQQLLQQRALKGNPPPEAVKKDLHGSGHYHGTKATGGEDDDEKEEDDDYGDDDDFEDQSDSDEENHNKLEELSAAFRESDTYGDAYEEELNMECERLRAALEQKMLAKFDA